MKPIPIGEAECIAKTYGFDQVVIIARKVDDATENGGEHVTTYGASPAHCEVAARIGTTLKHHLMKWPSALFQSGLRIAGVRRDADNPKALTLWSSKQLSDDDVRALHEFLKPTS